MRHPNQFQLLRERRFAPYFATQFLGAFNDNVFKNALLVMIAFQVQDSLGLSSHTLINLAAGLFILPFFLFSATAGWLADRADKARMIRRVKLAEIIIMAAGAAGLLLGEMPFLIGVLFLMGAQSAFFGPLKYGLLPQHLRRDELLGGNGMVGAGTFVAILVGTIAGGKLIVTEHGAELVAGGVLALAALGYLASLGIPAAPPSAHARLTQRVGTCQLLRDLRSNHTAFHAVLGISWFWFMGATYLAQLPNFVRLTIGGSVDVFTLLLCCFSAGIGLGALACERLSGRRVEPGLAPFGALLVSLFGFDLALAAPAAPLNAGLGEALGVGAFINASGGLRMSIDVLGIGVGGGLFAVPLNALVQQRSEADRRARVIAANNVLNALLMVLSAVLAIAVLGIAELSIAQLFALIATANLLALLALCARLHEIPLRCAAWLLASWRYRLRAQLPAALSEDGPLLLHCASSHRHAALLLLAELPRPALWLLDEAHFGGFSGRLWRGLGAQSLDDTVAVNAALARSLARGELVCVVGAEAPQLARLPRAALHLDIATGQAHLRATPGAESL